MVVGESQEIIYLLYFEQSLDVYLPHINEVELSPCSSSGTEFFLCKSAATELLCESVFYPEH